MGKYESVNIDDISNQGAEVEDGEYVLRFAAYKALTSKSAAKSPMVVIDFDVLEGKFEGFQVGDLSVLNAMTDKSGRTQYLAVSKWKAQMALIGKPFPKGFAFPLDGEAAGKALSRMLGNQRLAATVISEVSKKDGKTYRRVKITGLAPAASTVEDVDDQDFDDSEFEDGE
jgi:hypothetical protein